MSQHLEDGRLWAVDKRNGQKRRVLPHVIAASKNLTLAPSERARGRRATQLREPKPAPPVTITEPSTAPTPDFEPDNSPETANTPTTTPLEESS